MKTKAKMSKKFSPAVAIPCSFVPKQSFERIYHFAEAKKSVFPG